MMQALLYCSLAHPKHISLLPSSGSFASTSMRNFWLCSVFGLRVFLLLFDSEGIGALRSVSPEDPATRILWLKVRQGLQGSCCQLMWGHIHPAFIPLEEMLHKL